MISVGFASFAVGTKDSPLLSKVICGLVSVTFDRLITLLLAHSKQLGFAQVSNWWGFVFRLFLSDLRLVLPDWVGGISGVSPGELIVGRGLQLVGWSGCVCAGWSTLLCMCCR